MVYMIYDIQYYIYGDPSATETTKMISHLFVHGRLIYLLKRPPCQNVAFTLQYSSLFSCKCELI